MDASSLIPIDTLADWERLQSNFTEIIERALDTNLGPTASGAVRDALRQHLVQWRDRTFELAKSNVRVNGVDPDEASGEAEMEPFDEALNHQVFALEIERMAWEQTLSDYRRNDPHTLRELTEGMLKHERDIEYQSAPTEPENGLINFEFPPAIANLDSISESHANAVEQTRHIIERAPLLSERATRVTRVVDEVAQLS